MSVKDRQVDDHAINEQRKTFVKTAGRYDYGPQSPRNIDLVQGGNKVIFSLAPDYRQMNLCNIHFHAGAEHKGGEFTRYAGDGDGKGHNSGYLYTGSLSKNELNPLATDVCRGQYRGINAGDTIEVHYVHTSAHVVPGEKLDSCFNEMNKNPQLRVEAQVYVLVNDDDAVDFEHFTNVDQKDGRYQVENIPENTGTPVIYAGSTTGSSYNRKGSPFQVTWSIRPAVLKVNVESVGRWCKDNIFEEDHAHGVRSLVTDLKLLSPID
ncbi:MAG: delta-class carbonic anhydrase [Parahaliea sp.]